MRQRERERKCIYMRTGWKYVNLTFQSLDLTFFFFLLIFIVFLDGEKSSLEDGGKIF